MTPAPRGTKGRICLLYTGGTIGMVRGKGGELRPPQNPKDFLELAPELNKVVDFDFEPVMNKDSTNVNHRDWGVIARRIHELMHSNRGYDGYVVAHGTDTMHFSASAVSFALGGKLPAPIVFTGAQTIPEVHHGDARVNLMRACEVAVQDIGEVVISFGDYVFRGNRAQKKDEARFDAFESPALFPLANITERILIHPMMAPRVPGAAVPLKADFADGVLQISLIPGLTASLVTPAIENPECRGVILQSFGAGNVPHDEDLEDDPFSLLSIIQRCVELDKPVIVTSQFPANSTVQTSYATGRRAIDAGAIPTSNMTASCALAKFRWALAQADGAKDPLSKVEDVMSDVYVKEMDPIDHLVLEEMRARRRKRRTR